MEHPANAWKGIVIPVLLLLAFAIATRRFEIAFVAVAIGGALVVAVGILRPIAPTAPAEPARAPRTRVVPPASGPYLAAALFAGREAELVIPAGTPLPAQETVGLLVTTAGEGGATLDLCVSDGGDAAPRVPWRRVHAGFDAPLAPGDVAAIEFVLRVEADGALQVAASEEGRALIVTLDESPVAGLPVMGGTASSGESSPRPP